MKLRTATLLVVIALVLEALLSGGQFVVGLLHTDVPFWVWRIFNVCYFVLRLPLLAFFVVLLGKQRTAPELEAEGYAAPTGQSPTA